MTLRGIDLSNHNGPPEAYRGQPWYSEAQFIITQAINPPAGFAGHDVGGYTASQLRAAQADGKYAGVYVWLWNTFSSSVATKADIASRLALIPDDVRLDMRLWLDMEDTTQDHGPARQQDVLDALEVMDEWAAGKGLPPTGIYSGDWYIRGYMDAWFPPDRVYWMADYSLPPTVLPMRPLHQFTSTPVDMNVMLESEIVEESDMDCGPFKAAIERAQNRLELELAKRTAAGKPAALSRPIVREISSELFRALQ